MKMIAMKCIKIILQIHDHVNILFFIFILVIKVNIHKWKPQNEKAGQKVNIFFSVPGHQFFFLGSSLPFQLSWKSKCRVFVKKCSIFECKVETLETILVKTKVEIWIKMLKVSNDKSIDYQFSLSSFRHLMTTIY